MRDPASNSSALHGAAWLSLAVKDVAPLIGISPRQVWKLIELKQLKATKIGGRTVVRRVDLEEWLNGLADAQHPEREPEPISA